MNLKTHTKKDKMKWILTFGSILLLLVAVISLGIGLKNASKTTDTLGRNDYHIGVIDTTNGKIADSKQSLYSDMITVDGLEITVDENSQITYKVVFYGEEKEFISATESQSSDFDATVPANAEYCRIVITPNKVDGENVNLTIFNMGRYVDMLNVSYAK